MKPTFSLFMAWALQQKDGHYNFESPTDCIVARFVKASKEKLEFDGGNWSSMFPGETYMERLRNYHWLCGPGKASYKHVLLKMSNFI